MKKYLLGITLNSILIFSPMAFSACETPCKLAHGKISKNVYSAPITSQHLGRFQIIIPQFQKAYPKIQIFTAEEKWLSSINIIEPADEYVFYRIGITPKGTVSAAEMHEKFFNEMIKQANGFGGVPRIIHSTEFIFKGRPAYYQVYVQKTPGVKRFNKLVPADKSQTYTHAILLADYGKYLVYFWYQGSDLNASNPRAITEKNRQKIIQFKWKPFLDFINSLVLN